MTQHNRLLHGARAPRAVSTTALVTLATLLALAGCVRDEQPLMGDSTGTQTPQPPGGSPSTPTPG